MVAVSQAAGLVVIATAVAVSGHAPPAGQDLLPAAAAGIAGALALSALYRALAIGTMSIVAPISATGAVVPVVVGLATGDRPGALQLVGIAAAVIGVVAASREGEVSATGGPARAAGASLGLALLAAGGFGVFFVGMDAAADADVLWALLGARVASVAVLAAALAVRPSGLRVGGANLLPLVAVGMLEIAANGLFAVASTVGLVSLVAVLGSLYPVVTVMLAHGLLGERIRRVQAAGVATALAGVALIAAG